MPHFNRFYYFQVLKEDKMRTKNLLIISIIILCATTSFGQAITTANLTGVWTGNQLRVEFIDNSKVAVVFPGNKKQLGNYTADLLLNPATLEMFFDDGHTKLVFKCLIQFMENNTLKWEVFDKNSYPRNFTRGYAILTKVKN